MQFNYAQIVINSINNNSIINYTTIAKILVERIKYFDSKNVAN